MERDEIKEKLEMIVAMLRTLMRSRQSDKFILVQGEVERRGRMKTTDIMEFVQVERPTALNYMRKLGKQIDFTYRKGDAASRLSGIVVYDKSKTLQSHLQRLEKLFENQNSVTFSQIMNEFGIGLPETRDFVYYVCQTSKEYVVKDENKLERL